MNAKLKETPSEARPHLDMALKMVRYGLAEAKRSVMNLRSSALINSNLASALDQTVLQMKANQTVDVKLNVQGNDRPLPAQVENHLLHIGQEALTNAFRHSKAKKINIELLYEKQKVELLVKDDGMGFDLENVSGPSSAHFGLLGMREHAKQIGAIIKIQSKLDFGTEILVQVPVPLR